MPQVYPDTLLPKKEYKFIDCDITEEFLIRYVDRSNVNDSILDESGKLAVSRICSPKDHINDLSTCLLGWYKTEHTKIEFTQSGKALFNPYCSPDEEGPTPTYPDHFDLNQARTYWGIKIASLSNITPSIKLEDVSYKVSCFAKHTPTRGNFWHFSILWNVEGKTLEEFANNDPRLIKKIATKIGANARAAFANYATVEVFDHPGLNEPCFCKN
jgi:hypothetical protein